MSNFLLIPLTLDYIDPATTSYIIQIGAGVVIAVGTFLGIYLGKVKRFFRRNKDKEEQLPEAEKPETVEREVITAEDLLDDDDPKS